MKSSPPPPPPSKPDSLPERPGPAPRASIKRLRMLLFVFPLLFGWYTIIYRRNLTQPLPSTYAVCSHRNVSQIYTIDAKDSRAECLVVRDGLVADVGSLEDVRRDWGDVEMTGSGRGLKIRFLRKGEMMLPGM